MITALEVNREIDLSTFSRYLIQIGLMHRIVESGAMQILSVRNEADKANVLALYASYRAGEIELVEGNHNIQDRSTGTSRLLLEFLRAPLVMTILLANLITFPITIGADVGEFTDWFHLFTFLDFKVFGDQIFFADLDYTFSSGQYWRLLSPMFLHFGWMHIVFNALWIWEIGRRIEAKSGAAVLLLVVIVSSLTANFTQYWMSGEGLFGGMSGVVFGLLGFALCWHFASLKWQNAPQKIDLPIGIYVFMLAYLGIGFTGVIDLLGIGSLANGAHLGGLVGGMCVGAISIAMHYFSEKSRG